MGCQACMQQARGDQSMHEDTHAHNFVYMDVVCCGSKHSHSLLEQSFLSIGQARFH